MVKLSYVKNIEGLGKLYVCEAPFDKQLEVLKEAGINYPISVRDTAYMRLHDGPKDGTRTCHAPIWYKDALLLVARISPLVRDLDLAKQAAEANRNNKYFSTNNAELYEIFAEIAEKDKKKAPNKRRAIVLPSNDNFKINKNDEISLALFEDTAEEYFNRFATNGINFITPDRDYTQDKNGTGISYLWFRSPGSVSGLIGYDRCLYSDVNGAFGVSRSRGHAEGVAHEKLSYNKNELNKLIKIAESVKQGDSANSKLEAIIEFLNKLKQ